MSSLDSLITSDLAALGDDSRRNPTALDDALRTTNMYRDDRPGAEARRDALADERRRELVMMPLTLSHVFAHRVGRAAAGASALVCTLVIVAILGDPRLMFDAWWLVPGVDVGRICLFAALAIIAAYVIAVWIAESWFARRMRATLRTGNDPYRDLDELARGPVEIAKHAVRRVDGWAIGLFLGGMTSLALALGYITIIVGTLHGFRAVWSTDGVRQAGALLTNVDVLVFMVLAAVGFAFFVGRACQRTAPSPLIRRLGRRSALGAALAIGVLTMVLAAPELSHISHRRFLPIAMWRSLPSSDERYLLALGGALAIVGVSVWALLWWRRREQAQIGD